MGLRFKKLFIKGVLIILESKVKQKLSSSSSRLELQLLMSKT
jgi:hypothetical protein